MHIDGEIGEEEGQRRTLYVAAKQKKKPGRDEHDMLEKPGYRLPRGCCVQRCDAVVDGVVVFGAVGCRVDMLLYVLPISYANINSWSRHQTGLQVIHRAKNHDKRTSTAVTNKLPLHACANSQDHQSRTCVRVLVSW